MLIELTPRSAEIIAHEQKQRGAISPEHLIEQALEAYSGYSSPHTINTLEDLQKSIEEAWHDAEQNGSMPAEQAWDEINRSLRAR